MDTFFLVVTILGIGLLALSIILALFEPGLEYRIAEPTKCPLDSAEFSRMLAVLSDAQEHSNTKIEVLTNGDVFYEAELAAISEAQSHICLEAYIFQKGEVATRFIEALAERARAGVKVRLIFDAVGSFNTWRRDFRELIEAGGEVHWYMPFRWHNLLRYNHRTHRELLVVDGQVGFLGGAGIADHWWKDRRQWITGKRLKRWRDTMFRMEGHAVASLQSIFSENWVEASGELLTGVRYYPESEAAGSASTMVIDSTPSVGRATRARMLFQTLLASATRSIHITTPYFLPDRGARKALVDAVSQRGVEVKVIVPGKHSDHLLTRRSSRRIYGELLKAGAQIYEYKPAMLHTKSLVVDGVWSVVGSTNFDSRSFGLNDEMNIAALDETLAERLEEDFQRDLAESRRITYRKWRDRPIFERIHEWLGWILERQQ
jgi:cardiolipin synthase